MTFNPNQPTSATEYNAVPFGTFPQQMPGVSARYPSPWTDEVTPSPGFSIPPSNQFSSVGPHRRINGMAPGGGFEMFEEDPVYPHMAAQVWDVGGFGFANQNSMLGAPQYFASHNSYSSHVIQNPHGNMNPGVPPPSHPPPHPFGHGSHMGHQSMHSHQQPSLPSTMGGTSMQRQNSAPTTLTAPHGSQFSAQSSSVPQPAPIHMNGTLNHASSQHLGHRSIKDVGRHQKNVVKTVYGNRRPTKQEEARLREVKRKHLSHVLGIESVKTVFSTPVVKVTMSPKIVIKCEHGNVEDEPGDCRYTWFRGRNRMCVACGKKPGIFQCVTCLKLNLPKEESHFCSTECLVRNKNEHIQKHKEHSKSSKDVRTDIWFEDDCDKKHEHDVNETDEMEDNERIFSCNFPPQPGNEWTAVSDEREYTPTKEDLGACLLLEATPLQKDRDQKVINELTPKYYMTEAVLDLPPQLPDSKKNWHHTFSDMRGLDKFRVLSYNVLAEIYLLDDYKRWIKEYQLAWNYRRVLIMREIISYEPHIVCLQEVQSNFYRNFFEPKFKEMGFHGEFVEKNRHGFGEKQDGCAIFWKTDKFAKVAMETIDCNAEIRNMLLNQAAPKDKKMLQAKLDKPRRTRQTNDKDFHRIQKGNIGFLVHLREKDKGGRRPREFVIATTHIFWDPNYEDTKLWQTLVIAKKLEEYVAAHDNLPLVFAGDFNSVPESHVYEMLRTGKIEQYSQLTKTFGASYLPAKASTQLNMRLESCFEGHEPLFTNYTSKFIGTLDYIWHTKENVKCVGYKIMETTEQLLDEGTVYCPSAVRPSDHLPLVSEYAFADDYERYTNEHRPRPRKTYDSNGKSSSVMKSQRSRRNPPMGNRMRPRMRMSNPVGNGGMISKTMPWGNQNGSLTGSASVGSSSHHGYSRRDRHQQRPGPQPDRSNEFPEPPAREPPHTPSGTKRSTSSNMSSAMYGSGSHHSFSSSSIRHQRTGGGGGGSSSSSSYRSRNFTGYGGPTPPSSGLNSHHGDSRYRHTPSVDGHHRHRPAHSKR